MQVIMLLYLGTEFEMNKITEWRKIENYPLISKRSKFMIFHTPQKNISIPNLNIKNVSLKCVDMIIHQNMTWKSHIDSIVSKIEKSMDFLKRLKHFTNFNKSFDL